MTATVTSGVEEFAAAVASFDPAAGERVILELMETGADPIDIIDAVIAPSQHDAGMRWQRGEWTVAQQHAATEVAVAAAAALEGRLAPVQQPRGHVVLACAEREWHGLPIVLIGLAMRITGWETTVLGAGVSPLRLSRYLHELGPDATAISCSVLSGVPTTRRFIEASSAAGVPTVVGGAALGSDASRAGALGATSWASSARGAAHAMQELPLIVPAVRPLPREVIIEQAALRSQHATTLLDLSARWQPFGPLAADRAGPDSRAGVVRDCIDQTMHAVVAALITDDPSMLVETRSWVSEVLHARGDAQAPEHASQLGGFLATLLQEYPRTSALLSGSW